MNTNLEIIEQFVKRVCETAEDIFKEIRKPEGIHYAAMMIELQKMREFDKLADKIITFKNGSGVVDDTLKESATDRPAPKHARRR